MTSRTTRRHRGCGRILYLFSITASSSLEGALRRRRDVVRSFHLPSPPPPPQQRRTSRRALVLILQRTSGLGRLSLSLSLSRGGLESADSPLGERAFVVQRGTGGGLARRSTEHERWVALWRRNRDSKLIYHHRVCLILYANRRRRL